MPNGVYAAASAMVTETKSMDVIAENIANSQSSGYRRGIQVREDFAQYLRDSRGIEDGAGVRHDGAYRSFNNGDYQQTGAKLDVGVVGRGHFMQAVDHDGRLLLTRNGALQQTDAGLLVTPEGFPIQGQAGDIVLPADIVDVNIDGEGRISTRASGAVDFTFLDQLRVVEVQDESLPQLVPVSGQYFDPRDIPQVDAESPEVRQGWLEASNVDPVRELVDMISVQRRYDSAQRALSEQLNNSANHSDILAS